MPKQAKSSRRECWRQVLAPQKARGLSVQGFCPREERATAPFYAWKWRQEREPEGADWPIVGFAPVRIVPEPWGPVATGRIEIVRADGVAVRLSAGAVEREA